MPTYLGNTKDNGQEVVYTCGLPLFVSEDLDQDNIKNKTRSAVKQNGLMSWCALLDLNQRPSDYESPALTN